MISMFRASVIAGDWHNGQNSALYSLCSTCAWHFPKEFYLREIDACIPGNEKCQELKDLRRFVVKMHQCQPLKNAHILEIREKMGLKNLSRIPADFEFDAKVNLVGYPSHWTGAITDRLKASPTYLVGNFRVVCVPSIGRSKHRTFVECPCCRELIPFGRLTQHTKINRGAKKKS